MNDDSRSAAADEKSAKPGIGPLAAFLAMLSLSSLLALGAIHGNAPMLDEYAHIPAGISYWQLGRFSLYRETPPLVQCLVAVPALAFGAKVDYTNARAGRSEWNVGQDFLLANSAELPEIFTRSRCVVLALGLACGVMVFWWAAEAYGGWTAVVCASLWLFDPSVLAFSGIGTADVGSAMFGVLASYAFWRFLRRPDHSRTVVAGTGLGLALASKFNMLALGPAWLVLAVAARFDGRGRSASYWLMINVLVLGSKIPRLQATTSSRLPGWSTTDGSPTRVSTSSTTWCGSRNTARSCCRRTWASVCGRWCGTSARSWKSRSSRGM